MSIEMALPTVCIVADTLGYPEAGGHLWAYLNWALGFRDAGCRVIWLEPHWPELSETAVRELAGLLEAHGIVDLHGYPVADEAPVGISELQPLDALGEVDLLINLVYWIPEAVRRVARRTVLLDIDPGSTQVWFHEGDIELVAHDMYFTIGEGVATGLADVPDCGVEWRYVPPSVSLAAWEASPPAADGAFSTITHWWSDPLSLPDGKSLDNSKRVEFLKYLALPHATGLPLELAVSDDDVDDELSLLRDAGWRISDPVVAAGSAARYQAFVRASRGEFSCAKPAYVELRTGWISDRSVCYLAAGRPIVIQDTGPSSLLDPAQGDGVFRFRSPSDARDALLAASRSPEDQSRAAREVAAGAFDARANATRLLGDALV